MEVARAAVDELLNVLGKLRASSPLGREVADLLLRRNIAGKEKPEKTLREGFLATGCLGELFLAFRDLSIL